MRLKYYYIVAFDRRNSTLSRPTDRFTEQDAAISYAEMHGKQVVTAKDYKDMTGRDAGRDYKAEELSALGVD